jgi:U4/U6 small nuclear ribonucleoprotein PRP31
MEGTSTLADALLDDLDDLSDGEEEVANEERSQEELGGDGAHSKNTTGMQSGDALVSQFKWGGDSGKPSSSSNGPNKSVRLLEDAAFQGHLQLVNDELAKAGNDTKQPPAVAAVVLDDRHELLVNSNRYLIASMDELEDAHKSLCEAYHPKFPELEELLPNATQYVKSVGIIGNATDLTHKTIQDGLAKILTNHQIMTLTVSESTSDGRPLTNEEFQRVQEIALYMEEIIRVQSRLVDYIEKHMERLAPSVCALIGPRVAAKLLAMTGDLAALSKIPSCNLQVLGQVKQSRATHSTHHEGVLMECDLVQRCSKPMRRKALKVVAAKLALAIRCDYVNYESGRPRSARSGLALRQEIEQKFVKLQEPDKAPVLKALPK